CAFALISLPSLALLDMVAMYGFIVVLCEIYTPSSTFVEFSSCIVNFSPFSWGGVVCRHLMRVWMSRFGSARLFSILFYSHSLSLSLAFSATTICSESHNKRRKRICFCV
uniref:Secreted protein n=1 Tax=Parascaris univalens TaxID=6257 RepID=A0A915A4P6_PARUN